MLSSFFSKKEDSNSEQNEGEKRMFRIMDTLKRMWRIASFLSKAQN